MKQREAAEIARMIIALALASPQRCLLASHDVGGGVACSARSHLQRLRMLDDAPISLDEVEAAARRVGCEIKAKVTGPTYRVELLWEGGKEFPSPQVQTLGYQDDEPPPPELLGYSDGFTQPTGITHLETIEVRKFPLR